MRSVDAVQWQRVERLFHEAVALDPAQRAQFLARECGTDASLHSAVEALLQQDRSGVDPIEGAVSRAAHDLLQNEAGALLGRRFGAWRLWEQIASGGMGAVYLAQRSDGQFEQRAALKILNPALLSPDARGRFNAERQILARLSHPNIAHLIDGGTTPEGIPYLVMEYIEGTTIDRYCEERRLDIRARLRLVQKLCSAVEYAHRNLVIHRDIKPSNVLVDAQGEPKLLDFGVAKLLASETPIAAPVATVADLRAMTPRYASPEQIKGEPVTTSTDVYSLGLLLYELLTGRYPYREAKKTPSELTRAICETEPERPSSAARGGDRQAAGAGPGILSRALAGDLDNIMLMALRKEPARRYGSPRELSEDLARHLADQPVTARPATLRYRAAKFVRRHRAGLGAAVLLGVLVGAQAAFYTYRLIRERNAETAARVTAEEIAGFLESVFNGADPNNVQGKKVTVRDLLDQAAVRIDTALRAQPAARARLMQVIGKTYADIDLPDKGVPLMRRALALRVKLFGAESLPAAETMDRLGFALSEAGHTREARELLEHALRTRSALSPGDSLATAEVLSHMADLETDDGRIPQALRYCAQTKEMLERLHRTSDRFYVRTLLGLGALVGLAADYTAEERYQREAIQVSIAAGRLRDPLLADGYGNLADALRMQHRYAEAEQYYIKAIALKREVLGPDASDLDADLTNFGRFYLDLGQLDKAEPLMLEAVEVVRKHLGTKHVYYAYDLANLARLRAAQHRYAEADQLFRSVIQTYQQAAGPDYIFLGSARTDYGRMLLEAGRYEDGRAQLLKALAFFARSPEHVKDGEGFDQDARNLLGEALARLGKTKEAESLLVDGYEGLLRSQGPKNRRTQAARERVVAYYEAKGDERSAARYRAKVPD